MADLQDKHSAGPVTVSGIRILISTGIFPNRHDPSRGIYILRQAVELAKLATVRVVAPVRYWPRWLKSKRYSGYSRVPSQDVIEGLNVVHPRYVVIPGVLRFLHPLFLFVSLFACYRTVVKEFKPHIIIAFFAYPYGAATTAIAKAFGLPVMVGCLGSDINQVGDRGLRRRITKWVLRSCDRVLTVSYALRDAVVELGVQENKVVVIPNGVDRSVFGRMTRVEARSKLGLDGETRTVVCVSRLSREKGVDVLLSAFAQIRDVGVMLYIVGDGQEREALERMASELGLDGRAKFLGERPPSEIPIWLSAADLFVLPSRAEGHPNALLEAVASGAPVVAAEVGGVPEVVQSEELGIIVKAEDPEGLATGIREALQREWDRERIILLGGRRGWDDVARELIKTVEAVVGG